MVIRSLVGRGAAEPFRHLIPTTYENLPNRQSRHRAGSLAWPDGSPERHRSPIALLVPAVAQQREHDDQTVEELHIEAAEARGHDAGLDEGHRERAEGAAHDRADAPP